MGISDVSSITSAGSDVWLGGENGFTSSYLSEYTTSGVFVRSINTYPRVSAPTCITSDGIDIWVTSPEYQRFAEFNAQTGAYLRSSALVEEPTCIFYHGGRIWATTTTGNDDLFEFSASTGALLRHVKDADSAGEITFGSTSLFANRWYAGTASVVEYTYAGRIVKTLVSERDTRSIVFGTLAVVGKSLWTTNYLHKAIDIVPTS
jgi:hypothetical protein